jgi:hypothetical protein
MSRSTITPSGATSETVASDGAITLTVPITLRRRSQHRCVAPAAADGIARTGGATSLQRALARGHRWLRMLETGEAASVCDLAAREAEDRSYVGRMLNLTLLAPDIVAAILDQTLPESARLLDLAINPPLLWQEQRLMLGLRSRQP